MFGNKHITEVYWQMKKQNVFIQNIYASINVTPFYFDFRYSE